MDITKKRGLAFILLFVTLFLIPNVDAIYMGTCEGYIKNLGGGLLTGASVTVTVNGCSGEGCSGTDTSDANGYYAIANLNLPTGGTVSVSATYGDGSGSASTTANEYYAAFTNVTICEPPGEPLLNAVSDTHNTGKTTMSWFSGTDPNFYPTYDEFRLDGSITSPATSPQEPGLYDFKVYDWGARTCNSGCCSAWATDSFEIYNNAPSEPFVVAINDTHDLGIFVFAWTSGVDPEGDSTYDQYRINGNITNATSPHNYVIVDFDVYDWGVRTCDEFNYCSAWATDSFEIYNNAPSEPNITEQEPTDSKSISFVWDDGTDPDNDDVYSEFQLSNSSDFSNLIYDEITSSPFLVTNLDSPIVYYWRTRTCDIYDSCSAWVEDTFFVYPTTTTIVETSSGTSRSCSGGILIQQPKWECTDWSECDSYGLRSRTCTDTSNTSSINSFTEMETCFMKATCSDGFKNGNEEGIDCGGECQPCSFSEKIMGGFTQPTMQYPINVCETSGYYWIIILLLIVLLLSWTYFVTTRLKGKDKKKIDLKD